MLLKNFRLIFIIKYLIKLVLAILLVISILIIQDHRKHKILTPSEITNYIYELEIQRDLSKQDSSLGHDGKSANLQDDRAKDIGDKQLEEIGVNEELSEHISYNRIISDVRNPLCFDKVYDLKKLPSLSLIIVFHNEPYSIVLRTIHSAFNTVPKEVLKEIILIDDASTMEVLKGKFIYYIQSRFPNDIVKLHRLNNR